MKHVCILSLLMAWHGCSGPEDENRLPNIVVIMIDDLGYGDVGTYNDSINFTPNIDALAEGGMVWTDFHSNGPMCSPTRAAFLTGQYQYRFGERFEHALSARRHDKGFPDTVVTIADILKSKGYRTGMFGKWHLGVDEPYLPNNYGFDVFEGLLSGDGDHYTHINRWGMEDWWLNEELAMNEEYSVDRITDGSVQFIKENKGNPFFLYVSHLAIHFPWQGREDPPQREKGGDYTNDKWGVVPDRNNVRPHVVDMIRTVDGSVGKIIAELESQNLVGNTLVIFTSDNGGYRHYDHQFFNISDNGPLRGQKAEVYEGGHRVPFIAYWPGRISAGTRTTDLGMTMDLFPTFANITNVNISKYNTDGKDLWPVLTGNKKRKDRTVFWKMGNEWAIRKGGWKLVDLNGEQALFNLNEDIGEIDNLIDEFQEKANMLNNEFERQFNATRKY